MEKWHKIKCLALDVDGVMTDGSIFMGANGEWLRNFFIRDGMGLVQLREKGYKLAIITNSLALDIRERAKKLKIDFFYEGQNDKSKAFHELLKASGLQSYEVAYMGDDVIDLPVFELCGLSLAPADAHPDVLKRAEWTSKCNGGRGAIREVCDLLLQKGSL